MLDSYQSFLINGQYARDRASQFVPRQPAGILIVYAETAPSFKRPAMERRLSARESSAFIRLERIRVIQCSQRPHESPRGSGATGELGSWRRRMSRQSRIEIESCYCYRKIARWRWSHNSGRRNRRRNGESKNGDRAAAVG